MQTSTPTVLCIDCKHHTVSAIGEHRCQHPAFGSSPVTGEPVTVSCQDMRRDLLPPGKKQPHDLCGLEGQLFQPKGATRPHFCMQCVGTGLVRKPYSTKFVPCDACASISSWSAIDLVGSEPSQPLAVGDPMNDCIGGDASVVVEVYTLGRGVSIKGQGCDLPGSEGAFELKTHGESLVFDPLAPTKANWFVSSIQSDVGATTLPLEAVYQEDVAEIGGDGGFGQGRASYKTVILSLPPGLGKTTVGAALARKLGCTSIVDEWSPKYGVVPGALHLTNANLQGGLA